MEKSRHCFRRMPLWPSKNRQFGAFTGISRNSMMPGKQRSSNAAWGRCMPGRHRSLLEEGPESRRSLLLSHRLQ
jgi:hypothetical protein